MKHKVSEETNRKCPLGTQFYNFQPPRVTLSPQTPYLFHHRRRCPLANKLKTNCEKWTAQISMSGIAIVSMTTTPYDWLSFSATAELLVYYSRNVAYAWLSLSLFFFYHIATDRFRGGSKGPSAQTHDHLKKSCESCCRRDSVFRHWQWLNLPHIYHQGR